MNLLRLAARVARTAAMPMDPALSPEDLAHAADSFKFEMNPSKPGDENLKFYGWFELRGMSYSVNFSSDGSNIEMSMGEDPPEPLDETSYPDETSYSMGYFQPIFSVLIAKYGDAINRAVDEEFEAARDAAAEARDPYGYRGVKHSDFY
jgi:hypothetical protein